MMKFENLLQIIEQVSNSSLTKFTYKEEGIKISMEAEHSVSAPVVEYTLPVVPSVPSIAPEAVQINESGAASTAGNVVNSPLVGTFYTAASKDAPPYVAVGDTVKKGQILAIIEAMKLMNEIESEFEGEIAEIYVGNQQTVEYGQPLFRIV